jgi:arylsulfatase A-like enzyme
MPRLLLLLSLITPVFAQDRPNILLLFADDLGRYASAYVDPANPSVNDIVSTPAFDRIAREGVLATNAFVSVPSCSPSRAALISGRHFFRNGSHAQLHTPWNGDRANDPWNGVRGFALGLQDAGYHIGWSHKMHISEDRMGGRKRNYVKAGRNVNKFSQNVAEAPDIAQAKEALYEECRQNFQAFLADRKDGQPFYYSFHPTNPHRTWIQGSGKKLWGLDPDELEGKMPPFLPDVPVVREDLADYLGEGMAFDKSCEVILEELAKTGELDNTLIVISGDHGAPGFPRGKTNLYDFGSRVLFSARWPGQIKAGQEITRPISLIDLAPTFLAAAGLPPEPGTNGENLLPAFKSGDPEQLRGWALIGRETHVNTARPFELPYSSRAIRTDDHLYIINFTPDRTPQGNPLSLDSENPPSWEQVAANTRLTYGDVDAGPTRTWMLQHRHDPTYQFHWDLGFGPRPEFELYDLKKDPHQVNNLAADSAYKEIKKQLHAVLMAELLANHDPRLNGDQFDYPPYSKLGLPR